jgi:hypothetical protein
VNDLDDLFGREDLRSVPPCLRIDHMFADVILDDRRDAAIQRTPACGCLLKDVGTLIARLNRAFNQSWPEWLWKPSRARRRRRRLQRNIRFIVGSA